MASRSSSISSRMFGGGTSADIATLKAELAALKSGGVGINQDSLAGLNKTITEAKDIAIANDTKISNIENAVPSRDELTLAVADLPKKADKTALENLKTEVSTINIAVGENVAAINAEIAKKAAAADLTALALRVKALEDTLG